MKRDLIDGGFLAAECVPHDQPALVPQIGEQYQRGDVLRGGQESRRRRWRRGRQADAGLARTQSGGQEADAEVGRRGREGPGERQRGRRLGGVLLQGRQGAAALDRLAAGLLQNCVLGEDVLLLLPVLSCFKATDFEHYV